MGPRIDHSTDPGSLEYLTLDQNCIILKKLFTSHISLRDFESVTGGTMISRTIPTLMFLFLFCTPLSAQQQGQDSGGGGGQTTQGQDQPQQPAQKRTIFLSGQVALADGNEPSQPVRVELVCQNNVVRHDYASKSGSFSIEVSSGGSNVLQVMDASASSTPSGQLSGSLGNGLGGSSNLGSSGVGNNRYDSLNLGDCDLQAQLSGYQSDRVSLGLRRALDNPDVGTIVLYPMDRTLGGTVSVKTLAAPEDARKAYEKAGKELQKEKVNWKKVSKELEKAVEVYPEFASAWNMLGEARMQLNDRSGATEAFQKALEADAQYANPYIGLSLMAIEEEQWENAAQFSGQGLKLSPSHVGLHYFSALANSPLGNIDIAERSARLVLDSPQGRNYPLAHYVLGFVMSQRGDFQTAAAEYRQLVDSQPKSQLSGKLEMLLADWEQQGLIAQSGR